MIQRARSNEECPPVELLAQLRQPLQIEHLSNWNSPTSKKNRMHNPIIVSIWSAFETDAIACAGHDVIIPQESNDIFALLHTRMCVLVNLCVFAILLLLIQSQRLPGLGESAPEEENDARLELNVAFLGNRFNLVKGNSVAIHAVMVKAVLLGIRDVVD